MAHDSRSVLSRPAPPPDFTVSYGEHPDHVIDVCGAAGPLVIFLHGGFWRHEYDRTHTRPLASALAATGFIVATPEYRRSGAPGGGWPGTFDDVAAAVRAGPALVAERLGAVGPVILAGHSAGGHLALWAASRSPGHPGAAGVSAVVALAPVADLSRAYDLDLDAGAVRALLGGAPLELPERYVDASPRLPVGVPVTLLHGERDLQVPIEFSRTFAARATAAGDEVTLVELPDTDHFALIDPDSAAWPAVVAALHQGANRRDAG